MKITPACSVPPHLGGSPCPNHPVKPPHVPRPVPKPTFERWLGERQGGAS